MQIKLIAVCALCFIISAPGCRGFFGRSASPKLEQAEELTRKGDYTGAIAAYRAHIKVRESIADRPTWENPSFYELMIGDLELRRGAPEPALAAYQRAEKAGIDPGLVSDRYRSLGSWLEQNGRLDEALKILTTYRDRDPLLFDAMLDRIAKKMTREEDKSTAQSAAPTPLITPMSATTSQ